MIHASPTAHAVEVGLSIAAKFEARVILAHAVWVPPLAYAYAEGIPWPIEAYEEAARRGLRVFDATCPLVTKVHVEVGKLREQGREIVMIGHRGHPEVEGTMGQFEGGMYLVETVDDVALLSVRDPGRLAYVTQTTLSVDDAAAIVASLYFC